MNSAMQPSSTVISNQKATNPSASSNFEPCPAARHPARTKPPSEKNTVWPSAGQNLDNTRFNADEETISAANVSRLAVKWMFQTAGDVSATPAVDKKHVYFPDWGGKLYSLDRETGKAVWAKSIAEYTGVADSV